MNERMDETDAIKVLKNYLKNDKDKSKVPYLEEAEFMAYEALSNQKWLREKILEFENNQSKENANKLVDNIYRVFIREDNDNCEENEEDENE